MVYNNTVYIRKKNNLIDGVLLLWVDDILVCSGLTSACDILKEIGKYMEIECRGIPTRFVGIDINVTYNYIDISQRLYSSNFDVNDCDKIMNPLPLNVLSEEDNSRLLVDNEIEAYRSFLGKLIFIQHTRPDLVFSISFFGKYSKNPTERAYRLLYRTMQFAKQTCNRGIRYNIKYSNLINIKSWCDSSFGSYLNNAQTGYIICIDESPICWRSGVQRKVHHSTVKAECESMHDCIDRVILLAYFYSEFNFDVECSVYSDALDLVKLLASDHPKPIEKHMVIELKEMQKKLKFDDKELKKLVVPLLSVKDLLGYFSGKKIGLFHIPGKTNPADALTKPIDLYTLVSRFMVLVN